MLQQAGVRLSSGGSLSFERDIKPLITEAQRDALIWSFDMWDYDNFRQNAFEIVRRIEAGEPPFDTGWTAESLAMVRSWMREGLMAP